MILRGLLTFWCCFILFGAFYSPPKLYKTEGWTNNAKSQIVGYVIGMAFVLGVLALMWL